MSEALEVGESVKLSFCQVDVMGSDVAFEASVAEVVLEWRETVREELYGEEDLTQREALYVQPACTLMPRCDEVCQSV